MVDLLGDVDDRFPRPVAEPAVDLPDHLLDDPSVAQVGLAHPRGNGDLDKGELAAEGCIPLEEDLHGLKAFDEPLGVFQPVDPDPDRQVPQMVAFSK